MPDNPSPSVIILGQFSAFWGGFVQRREFIALIGGAATWPVLARAQQGERMRRVGVLMAYAESDPEGQGRVETFLRALQQLGWTNGRNVRIDSRWGGGDAGLIRQ